ncbi:PP2C-like domain-containing protein CG9801 [Thrips palmi]|uniref:PP2C-like domain-containing protein CG9801 n=1 Tax=Thrips palmi TaxID=161013 RepID=A0A6P9AA81_THRPL|nr:PP2C-like domain-containing protein CG9801 [Thrips palmi]
MPSLRKKVSSFIRQLSVANQQRENSLGDGRSPRNSADSQNGCFIQRYLSGQDVRRMAPTILHGRNPHELPPKALGEPDGGPESIVAALTGPDGGLTTVNRKQRHITTSDPDVDFIDILDQGENDKPPVASSECVFSPGYGRWFSVRSSDSPINNSVIKIRAAGSVFTIGTKSVHTSMTDLHLSESEEKQSNYHKPDTPMNDSGTQNVKLETKASTLKEKRVHLLDNTKELTVEEKPSANLSKEDKNNQNKTIILGSTSMEDSGIDCSPVTEEYLIPPPADFAGTLSREDSQEEGFLPIRKSKSAPNPFKKARANRKNGQELSNDVRRATCEEGTATSETPSSFVKVEEVAGVRDWTQPHRGAYGAATTLYELHPLSGINAGNPIADCFAVVARKDSAVLALADGVNWGQKACVAARSAVHGCVEYLNKAVFSNATPSKPTNTTEVFVALFRSFHAAHSLILQEEGMLTTLTAALVLPLAAPGRYVACVCNVGDSLAYVYNPQHGVREITQGSHDIHLMRDMRDALGALGPVAGSNPELNNLTCSMTEVQEGDIVFLTSDGISDNFDPVVGKFAVLPPDDDKNDSRTAVPSNSKHAQRGIRPRTSSAGHSSKSHTRGTPALNSEGLPTVQAYQRHELTLLRMEDLLKLGVSGQGPPIQDARELCDLLLDFATRITAAKRHILEDLELYCSIGENNTVQELSKMEQRARRRKICDKLSMVPGKLDHATVVAYQVGACSSLATENKNIPSLQETGL